MRLLWRYHPISTAHGDLAPVQDPQVGCGPVMRIAFALTSTDRYVSGEAQCAADVAVALKCWWS